MPLRPSYRYAKDIVLISRVDHDLGIQSTIATFDSLSQRGNRDAHVDCERSLIYSE